MPVSPSDRGLSPKPRTDRLGGVAAEGEAVGCSPTVAVLVAAYNAAGTLPACLDSLCGQTLHDIEILCVDDCSTDETLSLLRDRSALDARIHVLQTPVNSGQAVARNLALQQVKAPYVCMVDADDWLSADALEAAVQVMQQHPRTDCCVFHLRRHFDADGREEDYGLPQELEAGGMLTGEQAFELCLDGWQLHGLYLTRTPLHRQFPFDTATRLYSDDNSSRLHYLYSKEVRACAGIYYYRQHQLSMTQNFNLRRFDFMEANLSLLLTLKREGVAVRLLRRYEVHRWMTFIACYRLYLRHEAEIPETDRVLLHSRFHTILHTFRPSRLRWSARWKPGYWLLYSDRLFDWQQRAYCRFKGSSS